MQIIQHRITNIVNDNNLRDICINICFQEEGNYQCSFNKQKQFTILTIKSKRKLSDDEILSLGVIIGTFININIKQSDK